MIMVVQLKAKVRQGPRLGRGPAAAGCISRLSLILRVGTLSAQIRLSIRAGRFIQPFSSIGSSKKVQASFEPLSPSACKF